MNRLIATGWLAVACAAAAHGQVQTPYTLTGRIVSVLDGDTVVMQSGRIGTQNQTRIRLASIDAPERDHSQYPNPRPGQPYGDAAQKFLADLVQGRIITARCFEEDHYRRHVCDLLLARDQSGPATEGQTVNRRLVAAGLAWANQEAGGKFLRDAAMPELQRQARQARRGLWQMSHPRPIPPWQWRARCWRNGRCG